MAKVITLNDIAGMKDKKQLVLSKDTIITPCGIESYGARYLHYRRWWAKLGSTKRCRKRISC